MNPRVALAVLLAVLLLLSTLPAAPPNPFDYDTAYNQCKQRGEPFVVCKGCYTPTAFNATVVDGRFIELSPGYYVCYRNAAGQVVANWYPVNTSLTELTTRVSALIPQIVQGPCTGPKCRIK